MTNKEILQANLLDIVFEHRNKNYGAYALRKNYPQRLQWSVLIALALASLLFLITILKKDDPISPASKGEIILRTYGDEKPPEQQKQTTKPQKQVSTVKATSQFQFTNEKPDVPDLDDFENSKPSTATSTGTAPTLDTTTTATNTGNVNQTAQPSATEFHPTHKEAEFPGGKEAFARFLQMRLDTPEELEAGQKQAVAVRFMVDIDGNISKIEIVQSGGEKFDKEVIRVLKKMPKWKPAEQNEVKVPVYFTQVVTFVGLEQ